MYIVITRHKGGGGEGISTEELNICAGKKKLAPEETNGAKK